jgi:hypothetical protein
MPLFTANQLTERAQAGTTHFRSLSAGKYVSAKAMIAEHADPQRLRAYDVFLSHRKVDAEQLAALVSILEDEVKLSVCVDWKEFPELDRTKVTPSTAKTLRDAMGRSRCLFFVTTDNYADSKWMPWELGYFDGLKKKVAIVPVVTSASQAQAETYDGQEYLGLYPYVEKTNATLYVHRTSTELTAFSNWIASSDPFYRI